MSHLIYAQDDDAFEPSGWEDVVAPLNFLFDKGDKSVPAHIARYFSKPFQKTNMQRPAVLASMFLVNVMEEGAGKNEASVAVFEIAGKTLPITWNETFQAEDATGKMVEFPGVKKEFRNGLTRGLSKSTKNFYRKIPVARVELVPMQSNPQRGIIRIYCNVPYAHLKYVTDNDNTIMRVMTAWKSWPVTGSLFIEKDKPVKQEFKADKMLALITGEVMYVPFIDNRETLDEEMAASRMENRKDPAYWVAFTDFEKGRINYTDRNGIAIPFSIQNASEKIGPRTRMRILNYPPTFYGFDLVKMEKELQGLDSSERLSKYDMQRLKRAQDMPFRYYAENPGFKGVVDKLERQLMNDLERHKSNPINIFKSLGVLRVVKDSASHYSEIKEEIRAEQARIESITPEDAPELSNLPGVPDNSFFPHQSLAIARAAESDVYAFDIDMGGGKSLTYLADIIHQYRKKRAHKALIIMPNYLIPQQVNEYYTFTEGKMNFIVINTDTVGEMGRGDEGIDKAMSLIRNAPPNTVFITSYDWIKQDKMQMAGERNKKEYYFHRVERMKQAGIDMVTLDESHLIKGGKKTTGAQACMAFASVPIRRIGSGTMLTNNPEDIVEQYAFLDPSVFGTKQEFQSKYAAPGGVKGTIRKYKENAYQEIKQRMRTIGVSVRRSAWMKLLPDRVEKVHRVQASEEFLAVYRSILTTYIDQYLMTDPDFKKKWKEAQDSEDFVGASDALLARFSRMDIFLNFPLYTPKESDMDPKEYKKLSWWAGLVKQLPEKDQVCPKVPKIIEILDQHFASEDPGKVIIFTQYIDSAWHIWKNLGKYKGIARPYDGSVNRPELERFKHDDNIKILVACDKSLKLGHNLQMANRIIRCDVHWNPGDQEQANARIYRPKQKRKVFIDILLTDGTVECVKYARLVSKYHMNREINSEIPGGDGVTLPILVMNEQTMTDPQYSEYGRLTPYFERMEDINQRELQEAEQWGDMIGTQMVPFHLGEDIEGGKAVPVPFLKGMDDTIKEVGKGETMFPTEKDDEIPLDDKELEVQFLVIDGTYNLMVKKDDPDSKLLRSLGFEWQAPYYYYTGSVAQMKVMLNKVDKRFGIAGTKEPLLHDLKIFLQKRKKMKVKKGEEAMVSGGYYETHATFPWKRGMRIVIDWGDDGYFMGDIVAKKGSTVYVRYDDGEEIKYDVSDPRLVGEGVKKKTKWPIRKKELKKWVKKFVPDREQGKEPVRETPEPDEEAPKKKKIVKRPPKEDEEPPVKKKKREEEEEEEPPVKKKKRDEEEEEFPIKKKKREPVEEEEFPIKKKKRDEEPPVKKRKDDEEKPPKKFTKGPPKEDDDEDLDLEPPIETAPVKPGDEEGLSIYFVTMGNNPMLICDEEDQPEASKLRAIGWDRERGAMMRECGSKALVKRIIDRIERKGVKISNREQLAHDVKTWTKMAI